MSRFTLIAAAPTPKGLRHVSDLVLLPDGRHTAALDRETGEVRAFDLATGLRTLGPGVPHGLDPLADLRLGLATVDGTDFVTVSQSGVVKLLGLYNGDRLDGTVTTLTASADLPLATTAEATLPTFVAGANGGGIAWLDFAGPAPGVAGRAPDTETIYAADVSLAVGAGSHLVTASAHENGITVWAAETDGLVAVGAVGAEEGLGIAGPTALVHATVAGLDYVVLAASGSSSLSVMRVDAGGMPVPTDHLIDDAGSRFGSVQALARAQIDGRTFLVAGGGDSGVTLLTLMPGGRLVTLDTVSAVGGAAIGAVTALAMTGIDGALRIVATTEDRQLIEITVDPGDVGRQIAGAGLVEGTAADDLIEGSEQADTLMGGAGDDVMRDGAGQDVLIGGEGADTFIMSYDGEPDVIEDFEAGIDRLDLSEWPLLRSAEQIAATQLVDGIRLEARGEELTIHSRDGAELTLDDVLGDGFLNGSRALPDVVPQGVMILEEGEVMGTAGADTIEGGADADVIFGMDGHDRLIGGGGDDQLFGGAGNDVMDGESGDDVLLGGDGDDALSGGDGNDVLLGGAGRDSMNGDAGDDVLVAIEGISHLVGHDAADALHGGAEADLLIGRGGDDVLKGEDGADILLGGGGGDALHGGAGADHLMGDAGGDVLDGGAGDDVLMGGAGEDTFVLRRGNDHDRILDFDAAEDRIVLDVALWSDSLGAEEALVAFGRQEGPDAVLDFGEDTLLIQNVTLAELATVIDLA